ncbi:MAG: hypothetical protein KC503_17390 [Myxococcales bacterium]|nr:hypothetical protein [Myxococcales bacterium]
MLYLSVDEIQQATFAARVYFDTKAQRIDPANEVILDREIEYQMLQRMILRSEDPKAKLFPRVEDLRPALSVNECQYFMDEQERIKIAEWTSWFAELDHPALRQIARVLDLPMTTTPTELAEAVQGLRETAEALTEALK